MANTARVTQSFFLAGTLQNGAARVTQSYIILAIGVGVTCGNPPAGQIGVPYSHTFPGGGGEPPLTYSISAGTLPPGLALNASTGVVSGTPTGIGPFAFTVTVTDALTASASVSCSITIAGSIIIQLIGWKLYPDPPCDTLPSMVLEVPSVKRAV